MDNQINHLLEPTKTYNVELDENIYLTLRKLQKKRRWSRWLHEIVSFDGEYLQRHRAYALFTQNVLIPFVCENGYTWSKAKKQITNDLANYVFSRQEWVFQENGRVEDFHYYIEQIDDSKWSSIWSYWSTMFDDMSSRSLQNDICIFVWNRLNLYESFATKEVDWLLDGNENDTEENCLFNEFSSSGNIYMKDKNSLY